MVGTLLDSAALIDILRSATFPGAAGGLVAFILAYVKGHYSNNKYFVKATCEIVGGMIVASFLAPQLFSTRVVLIAFLIGASWSVVMQATRSRITRLVEAELGNPLKRNKEDT